MTLRYRSARYEIKVENPDNVCRGVATIEIDGDTLTDRAGIPLVDDGLTHRMRAVLGKLNTTMGGPH